MLTCYWCVFPPFLRRTPFIPLTFFSLSSLAIVFIGLLWLYTIRLNKQKAVQLAQYESEKGHDEGIIDAWHDQVRRLFLFLLPSTLTSSFLVAD